jgi:hypothetical protein
MPFYQHQPSASPSPSFVPDPSLATFLTQLVEKKDKLCIACSSLNGEHSFVICHNRERIELSIRSVDEHDGLGPLLKTWTTCRRCLAATSPKPVSPVSASLSFAKFLELLLYDGELVPLPDLCEHASVDRGALVRSFSLGGSVVEFRINSIAFVLRLSLISSSTNHSLPSTDSSNSASRLLWILKFISTRRRSTTLAQLRSTTSKARLVRRYFPFRFDVSSDDCPPYRVFLRLCRPPHRRSRRLRRSHLHGRESELFPSQPRRLYRHYRRDE